jgi:hypothetical protein
MTKKINFNKDFLQGLFIWYIVSGLFFGLTDLTKLINIMIPAVVGKCQKGNKNRSGKCGRMKSLNGDSCNQSEGFKKNCPAKRIP